MRVSDTNPKHYIADEGKVFRCKCHGVIMGNELYLDKIQKDGVMEHDSIENYEEVDAPEAPEFEENM